MLQGRFARSVLTRVRRTRQKEREKTPPEISSPAEARAELQMIASTLRRQKVALGLVIASLSQATVEGDGFDVARELAGGAECVRTDLLTDAIETLETLAKLDDEALRRRFEQRWALHKEY